jgi:hypothetical protein
MQIIAIKRKKWSHQIGFLSLRDFARSVEVHDKQRATLGIMPVLAMELLAFWVKDHVVYGFQLILRWSSCVNPLTNEKCQQSER